MPLPVLARATAPLKALAAALRLMAPLVAVKLALPLATFREAPLACVMLPVAVTVRLPVVTVTLPRLRALLLAKLTLAATLVVRLTAPLKALPVLPRAMAPLTALKLEVPTTVRVVLVALAMMFAA